MNPTQKDRVWRQVMHDIEREQLWCTGRNAAAAFLAGFRLGLLITKGD